MKENNKTWKIYNNFKKKDLFFFNHLSILTYVVFFSYPFIFVTRYKRNECLYLLLLSDYNNYLKDTTRKCHCDISYLSGFFFLLSYRSLTQ